MVALAIAVAVVVAVAVHPAVRSPAATYQAVRAKFRQLFITASCLSLPAVTPRQAHPGLAVAGSGLATPYPSTTGTNAT